MNQRNVDAFKEKTGKARNKMKRKRGRASKKTARSPKVEKKTAGKWKRY
jgi:hypothetical protein